MKSFLVYFAFAVNIFSMNSAEGRGDGFVLVGNGGDFIQCQVQGNNERLNGVYSLDYVGTFAFEQGPHYAKPLTWQQSKARISRLLAMHVPHLAVEFDEFVELLFNTNRAKKRVWIGRPASVHDIQDSFLMFKLPSECYRVVDGKNKPNIIQGVIREPRGEKIIYYYDNRYFGVDLQQVNPDPSFSFMVVHEWLRDYTSDARLIREINNWIHSDAFESAKNVNLTLEQMGFKNLPREEDVLVKKQSFRTITLEVIDGKFVVNGFAPFDKRIKQEFSFHLMNRTDYTVLLRSKSISGFSFTLETLESNSDEWHRVEAADREFVEDEEYELIFKKDRQEIERYFLGRKLAP